MYEYRVTQLLAGGNIQHLNERIGHMVADGWEPIMMTGDTIISVMLRRAVQTGQQQAHAQQARHPSMMPAEQPAAAPAAPVAPPRPAV